MSLSSKNKNVILLVGPTASGKTRVSLEIASKIKAEIVSADSRQVYKRMNIGTAKPSDDELQTIPHHCIDIREPHEYFSAGQFGRLARPIIDDIFSRDKQPIVVGGSGLYIRALVDGVFEGNYRDESVRMKLRNKAEEQGIDFLYGRLKKVDPLASEKIHANDLRRIVRALEVYEVTGQPISIIQKENTEPADFSPHFYALSWDREVIYGRIESRVDLMVTDGLVNEVRLLLEKGYSLDDNAMDSVGYKEIVQHLNGEISLDEAIGLIKQNTRRFAKKQMTWFRQDKRIQWIDVADPVDWSGLADFILKDIS